MTSMVEIGEVTSRVRAIGDIDLPISDRTLHQIVQVCLAAVRDEREHESRVLAERRITSGVRDEQEGEA